MEYRKLDGSDLTLPVLSFGTATFGGVGAFESWGATDVTDAQQFIDICLDHGVNLFDTANAYSYGASEEILGATIAAKRGQVLISTKAGAPMGSPDESGSSRRTLMRACEESLRRLNTSYIDIYYIHIFDATTPVEETLRCLEDLVRSGKVRYIGCSNFSGWHLMKSLALSERYGWARYAVHQAYYSLLSREYEWELMPLALNQRVGTVVWSPLAGGALTETFRCGEPSPHRSRVAVQGMTPSVGAEKLSEITDTLQNIAIEVGKTVSQVALNWTLQRPSITSVTVGARTLDQLKENLGATGWTLDPSQVAKLDEVSETQPIYPYWHQRWFPGLNPPPVPVRLDTTTAAQAERAPVA